MIEHSSVMKYDKKELLYLLSQDKIHSPEYSETDEENSQRKISVYDYSWRSNEVLYRYSSFLLHIFDIYIITITCFSSGNSFEKCSTLIPCRYRVRNQKENAFIMTKLNILTAHIQNGCPNGATLSNKMQYMILILMAMVNLSISVFKIHFCN